MVSENMSVKEKTSILIVDDDKDLCDMLQKYFSIKGYDVDVAFDGDAAIEKAMSSHFDLIVLDIMMPGIDGYEVCQRLKIQREYNQIPIVMLSAKDTEQDRIIGFKTGADAYVSKPFEIGSLNKTIQETIEKRRRMTEDLGVMHEISFEIESRFSYLEKVNEMIGQLFLRTEMAPDEIWELKLAMHELGINAIEHGNKKDPEKQVRIKCTIYDNKLEFTIQDEGEGFEFDSLPDPTDEKGIKRDRGRGIFLVGKMVDQVEYIDNGSTVRMVRFLNRSRKRYESPRLTR